MKKIPIHLLIRDFDTYVKKWREFIKVIDIKNIVYIWLPVSNKDEIREVKSIDSYIPLLPVWYVKNSDLLPEVIDRDNLNVAFPINFLENEKLLKVYKDLFTAHKPKVYVVDDKYSKRGSDKSRLLKIVKNVSEDLRKSGINNIYFSLSNTDTGELIDIYIKSKRNTKGSFIIPFNSSKNRNEAILKNSLLIGNLFYNKISDSILVEYEDLDSYKEFINEDINLIKTILSSLGIVKVGYTIISCPKCGRCQMDLLKINREVDEYLSKLEEEYNKKGVHLEDIGGITVAVMGCNVNGPGEARGADIGIAGGKNGKGTIFKYGTPFETLPENRVVDRFLYYVKNLIDKKLEESGVKVS